MDPHYFANLLVWFVVFIFSTTCHEAGHAWIAYLGGDATAYEGGQMSLDPMPHIRREPLGMVVMPLVTFFLYDGNWMLGFASAPVNILWAQRNPRKYAAVSAAGPAVNFSIAFLAALVIWVFVLLGHLGLTHPDSSLISMVMAPQVNGESSATLTLLARALSLLFGLNIILGLFNLIPLPPLDGGGVVEGLWPEKAGGFYRSIRSQGGFMTLIISMFVFSFVGWPIFRFLKVQFFSFVVATL